MQTPPKTPTEDPIYETMFTPDQRAKLARRNYDESKVGPYRLPEPLIDSAGRAVDSVEAWEERRKPELLALFEQQVYGAMFPKLPIAIREVERCPNVLGGKATRLQWEITFPSNPGPVLRLAIHLPQHATPQSPVPCFLGLNFTGNHGAFPDPEVTISDGWFLEGPTMPGIVNYRATEASRGQRTSRWPLEMIIDRGYALATAYYGEIEPDHPDGFRDGMRAFFLSPDEPRGEGDAGAITTWAWGLSRLMDALEQLPEIDAKRVALTGHSRLGKTALWAAACDERFALVIANNSGCGGASISQRNYGETLEILSYARPYWFCEACRSTSRDMTTFPVDQHLLISLIAPRPVFVSSAEDDPGADPQGEFLGAFHADPVYRLLGTDGMAATQRPPLSQPILSTLGYWIRPGGHDITSDDWKVHLAFADRHLRG